jgi:hypothetical protein
VPGRNESVQRFSSLPFFSLVIQSADVNPLISPLSSIALTAAGGTNFRCAAVTASTRKRRSEMHARSLGACPFAQTACAVPRSGSSVSRAGYECINLTENIESCSLSSSSSDPFLQQDEHALTLPLPLPSFPSFLALSLSGGGCRYPLAGEPAGQDCTEIVSRYPSLLIHGPKELTLFCSLQPGTDAVSCVRSQCVIDSCRKGFSLSADGSKCL